MASEENIRLVHLDLKGAPPKVSYYHQIFPLLRKWGATGLLIEYEDMFPYSGDIKELAAPNAYSVEDIGDILQLARDNELIVIPLVQTFGHFEFVLKHDKFHCLREVPLYPLTLCPTHTDSMKLLQLMIDQVMQLHPDIRWFHIGADEVFNIGHCVYCRERQMQEDLTGEQLFFDHVTRVIKYMKTTYPDKHVIMWDDMFRDLSLEVLQGAGIGELVEPMVWTYCRSLALPPDIWDRYAKVFPNVWGASAFKGATGPCMYVTDISHHLENHQAWNDAIRKHRHKFQQFRGCAITGWQRYDHYSILCELLPVGLPSLALCLQTLTVGAFTENVHKSISIDMGFQEVIPLNPFQSVGLGLQCNFPGGNVFLAAQVLLHIESQYTLLLKSDKLNGWMSNYHLKHNYTNPAHVDYVMTAATDLLGSLQKLQANFEKCLLEVFYPDTVDEWLTVRIQPMVEKLQELEGKAQEQIALGGRVKDYKPAAQPGTL